MVIYIDRNPLAMPNDGTNADSTADVSGVFMKVYKYNPQTDTTDAPVEYPLNFLETRTENGANYDVYSLNFTAPSTPSSIYYKFRVVDGTSQAFYTDDHDNLGQGGDGAATDNEPFSSFQMTVYASNFTTPTWLQNASVYQVFPDRFRNGDISNDWCRAGNTTGCPSLYGGSPSDNIIQTIWNSQMQDSRSTGNNNAYGAQFYGGDLKGIQDKLDYIKSMGFDTIYLSPIFKARSNHRYDADDYFGFARGFDFEDNDDNGSNKIFGLTPSQFARAMQAIREDYPLPAQRSMLNLIDSHDTNRALYALKNSFESSQEAKSRMKLAALFQFTYIGAPMVYYGDEAGINAPSLGNSGSGLPEDDPYNRAPYPWADEAGSQNIYGPVDADLISFYTKLGSLRRSYSSLRTGNYATLLTGDATTSFTDNNTFAFIRTDANNKVVVVMNNGTTSNTATIPGGTYYANGTTLTDQLGSSSFAPNASYTVSGGTITITLPARSGAILSNLAPTGANASVRGRVLNVKRLGIANISVTLTDNQGNTRRTATEALGEYSFDEVESGATYIVTVNSKRYRFTRPTRIISVNEDVNDVNFSTISYSTSIR